MSTTGLGFAALLRRWVGRAVYLVPMVAVGESIRRSDDDMNLAGLVFAMYLPARCMLVVLVELSVYVLRHP